MSETSIRRIHWSFRVIVTVMLIWNVLGCINFMIQMNPDTLAAYRESERAIIENRPVWATLAFAVAVFGGALGCILLLLRKSAAVHVLIASLLGVGLTTIHTLGIGVAFGVGEIVGIILMPLAAAAVLIWYAMLARRKGWIS